MGVKRFGDWKDVKSRLTSQGKRLEKAILKATVQNALLLVREIQLGIRSQSPGGQDFVKLSPLTIKRKHSSKALIDTGFLINAITQKIMKDKAFVGLLKTSFNREGEMLANIGAVMEYGATITHPNKATIIIPPRPFLHPVMEKYRQVIIENYSQAIRQEL